MNRFYAISFLVVLVVVAMAGGVITASINDTLWYLWIGVCALGGYWGQPVFHRLWNEEDR